MYCIPSPHKDCKKAFIIFSLSLNNLFEYFRKKKKKKKKERGKDILINLLNKLKIKSIKIERLFHEKINLKNKDKPYQVFIGTSKERK